jgi:hypothetical protein
LYFKRCGTGKRYAEKITLHFKHCISNVANWNSTGKSTGKWNVL